MVASLAGQVREAYAAGCNAGAEDNGEVGGIVVAGMGGSAIGADAVAAAYEAALPGAMVTVRGYDLPGWVGARSLVFAVSYSGNTEETISCLKEAIRRGCRIICVSSGGEMARIAGGEELPLIEVPASLQPRAAMGWLSIPIAACLENLGLVAGVEADIEETAAALEQLAALYGPESPLKENPAKQLAERLFERIPVIYGAGLTAVAARRWKCQINENAKSLAFANEYPELNHNEIVGWQYPAQALERFRVIHLSDGGSHPQNHKRMQITAGLLKDYVGDIEEHQAIGNSRLARLFSSVYLGDYLSLYLAVLYGIDPSPVERIEDLKKRLA